MGGVCVITSATRMETIGCHKHTQYTLNIYSGIEIVLHLLWCTFYTILPLAAIRNTQEQAKTEIRGLRWQDPKIKKNTKYCIFLLSRGSQTERL